jgi:adenine-specific DNA methylase
MTFFLRDNDNDKTIVDIEFYVNDGYFELHSAILLRNYTNKLFTLDGKSKFDYINYMELASEIRGWFFEDFCQHHDCVYTEETYEKAIEAIRKVLKNISKHTDTYLIED